MKKTSYLVIGIATGLFTATLVGLSLASYSKSKRKLSRRINSLDNTRASIPQSAEQVEDMTV